MQFSSLPLKIVNSILKIFFTLQVKSAYQIKDIKKTLLVYTHFNLGELIASTSLYRAIKEKFPQSDLIVVVGDDLFTQINNHLIDEFIVVKKHKLFNPFYFYSSFRKVKTQFDLVIVPSIGKNSIFSDYIARLSNSKIKVGTKSLDGVENKTNYCFNVQIDLNFSKYPDANISEKVLEIVRPLGFDTIDLSTKLIITDYYYERAKAKLSLVKKEQSTVLIGLNVVSEDAANNWYINNFTALMDRLNSGFKSAFYLFGDNNNDSIKFIKQKSTIPFLIFNDKNILETAATISLSDIFITVDSTLMHIAGTTTTPQVSIFGNTNPFNFAPCGKNKIFLKKSDLIDDISVDDVYEVCKILLSNPDKTV